MAGDPARVRRRARIGSIRERAKGYSFLLLMLETSLLGVFTARDWSLFYVFWELTLIPLFFLIDRWGGQPQPRGAQFRALHAWAARCSC